MKNKFIFAIPFIFACCLLLSVKVFAISNSDIIINVASPINDLQNESGMVAVENFPENITIGVMAQTGKITDVQLEYSDQSRSIEPEYIRSVWSLYHYCKNRPGCSTYHHGKCLVSSKSHL